MARDRPSAEAVRVDSIACERVAARLRSLDVPDDKEDSRLPGMSRLDIGNFYLFTVAICHQTSPTGRPPLQGLVHGISKRGWDYLTARFEQHVRDRSELLRPNVWASLTGEEIALLFRDDKFGDLLTNPTERGELIRDLGARMQASGWTWAEDLFMLCGGRVATSEPNLLRALGQFDAYRDPVKKKSLLFLAIMRNQGLWTYPDEDQLGPPVDYHEVRGHLRLGTVKVDGPRLAAKLLNREAVTDGEDIAIRRAVYEAVMLISQKALMTPSQLHYLFWNVFRSCCLREMPHCMRCPPDCSLPGRYVEAAMRLGGSRRCTFQEVCASAKAERRYYEHVFETTYY